ncbi:uncharacterized protein [Leptinotarsa decemlineata]|uniref:uncharacterized protein n=1 Tax=Leptinotarsa decemlineata TaxID=7539 RepID=UPI003D30C620
MQLNKEKDDDAELSEEVTDEVFDEMSPKVPKITKNEALANVTLKTDGRVSSQKRKKVNFRDEILSAINKTRSEREAIISLLTSTLPEDEIDVFFISLAMTVKTFPPLLRAQTKSKLFQVISGAELQLLAPQPPAHSPLSTNSYKTSTTSSPLQSPSNWDQQNHIDPSYDQLVDTSDTANYFWSYNVT